MLRTLKCLELIYSNNATTSLPYIDKFNTVVHKNLLQFRFISCSIQCRTNSENEDEQKIKKKKTPRIPKITLLYDNTITVMDMENAQKLAKRRNLNLIKVTDSEAKSERPTYKLVSSKDYVDKQIGDHPMESDKGQKILKSMKLFPIHSKINDNDLFIKLRNINKVLNKLHKVRIVINHNDNSVEKVINTIKNNVEGKIVQIVSKQGSTICQIQPIANKTNTKEESNEKIPSKKN